MEGTTLGQRIRAARKARRMTQRDLGGGTLSESFISMVEHNRVKPSLATLQRLSERLGEPLTAFLDTPPTPAEQAEVVLRRGEALLRQHRFTEAVEAFASSSAAVSGSGSVILLIRMELGLGQGLTGLRQFDLAEQHVRAARALAESANLPEWLAASGHAQGFLAFRARRFDEARDILQDAMVRLRRSTGGGQVLGKLHALLGRTYVELGLPAQALESFHAAAEQLAAAADPSHQALLHYNMGIAYEQQRSFDLARSHLEQAAELFRLHENLHLLSVAVRSLGMLRLEQGDLHGARSALEQSLRLSIQVGDDEGRAQTLVELARAEVRRGEVELGRRAAEEARALATRLSDHAEAARAEVVLAEAAKAAGRLQDAAERLTAAAETFKHLQMEADFAQASRDLGFVLMEQGEMAAAAQQFAQAFAHQSPVVTLRGWRGTDGNV